MTKATPKERVLKAIDTAARKVAKQNKWSVSDAEEAICEVVVDSIKTHITTLLTMEEMKLCMMAEDD